MNWKCLRANLETRCSHSLGADAFNKDSVCCPKISKDPFSCMCVGVCTCMEWESGMCLFSGGSRLMFGNHQCSSALFHCIRVDLSLTQNWWVMASLN